MRIVPLTWPFNLSLCPLTIPTSPGTSLYLDLVNTFRINSALNYFTQNCFLIIPKLLMAVPKGPSAGRSSTEHETFHHSHQHADDPPSMLEHSLRFRPQKRSISWWILREVSETIVQLLQILARIFFPCQSSPRNLSFYPKFKCIPVHVRSLDTIKVLRHKFMNEPIFFGIC